MKKIDIDSRYFPEEELNHNQLPYISLTKILHDVFNFNSVFDAGCRDGKLIEELKKFDSNTKLRGCDYFQWALDAADDSVKNLIYRFDLRDQLDEEKYDLVTCFEVAEHIDVDYCDVFLENLKNVTGKYMVITWSDSGGENQREFDTHLQHLNPLQRDQVIEKVSKHFNYEESLTDKFLERSHGEPDFLWYWRKSLTVWSPK